MNAERLPRVSWSQLGVVISIGLVMFGVVDATLPHSRAAEVGGSTNAHTRATAEQAKASTTPMRSDENTQAQRVAERFVVVTDTTDTTHTEGDRAELAMLAPRLIAPRQLQWPEAWVVEDRRTTVALDQPGPAVAIGAAQIAVLVTGRMLVTTDVGRPTAVPIDERITLRRIRSAGDASRWVVTGIGTGS